MASGAALHEREQPDLDSLIHISQHLSEFLDGPETQPRVLWPLKFDSKPSPPTALPKLTDMPRLASINGSKLHTYPMKTAPYPLSYDQTMLDR